MFTVKTILHPTDFSHHSEYALWVASMLARDHNARLVVLHVAQIPLVNLVSYGEMVTIEPRERLRAQARAGLDGVRVPIDGLKIDRRQEEGDPATEIARVAKETQCDLVVMGTHGRSGLGRLLLGSVAESVLRKAPCPVVVVKNPLPAPEGRNWSTCRPPCSAESRRHSPCC